MRGLLIECFEPSQCHGAWLVRGRPVGRDALLRAFAHGAIVDVEHVTPDRYARSIELDRNTGSIEVTHLPDKAALVLEVRFTEPSALLTIVERVRRMFDLGADPSVLHDHLGTDPLLGPALARHPGIRVPGTWDGHW